MKYTDIIWDFNGTILDDVLAGILSVNKLLRERGLATIEDEEHYRSVFKFPIIEYYRDLGFDFDSEPYEVLAPLWVNEYLKNCKNSPIRKGFKEAFEAFKALGLRQHVLSATELTMLRSQLSELSIEDCFDGIYGLDNIHAKSKKDIGVAWKNANPDIRALMIGDTDHDAEVAAAMGVDCVLVAAGHQNRDKLEKCNCIAVVDTVKDVLNLL